MVKLKGNFLKNEIKFLLKIAASVVIILLILAIWFGYSLKSSAEGHPQYCSDGLNMEQSTGFCCAYIPTLKAEVILVPDGTDGAFKRDRTLTPKEEQIACDFVKQLRGA